MGRPKKALISRRKTLEAALRIIDAEGLEALSIRRLGAELNVRGISLYHHFENKDQILTGVCELAFAFVRTPRTSNVSWREWLLDNSVEYYNALRRHPNLIPILTVRNPFKLGIAELNATAGLLAVQGVPPAAILPLLEVGETFAFGCASYELAVSRDPVGDDWGADYPALYHALRVRGGSVADSFRRCMGSLLDATIAIFQEDEATAASAGAADGGRA